MSGKEGPDKLIDFALQIIQCDLVTTLKAEMELRKIEMNGFDLPDQVDYGNPRGDIDNLVGEDYDGVIEFKRLSTGMQEMIRTNTTFCEAAGITVTVIANDVLAEGQERERSTSDSFNSSGFTELTNKRAKPSDEGNIDVASVTTTECEVCHQAVGDDALRFRMNEKNHIVCLSDQCRGSFNLSASDVREMRREEQKTARDELRTAIGTLASSSGLPPTIPTASEDEGQQKTVAQQLEAINKTNTRLINEKKGDLRIIANSLEEAAKRRVMSIFLWNYGQTRARRCWLFPPTRLQSMKYWHIRLYRP